MALFPLPSYSESDPFRCPFDPVSQRDISRTITYDFTCNASLPFGTMVILGVGEPSPCNFTIYLESLHGCGCSPDCDNKNCGSDGCGGYCGSEGQGGMCPSGYSCLSDQICTSVLLAHYSFIEYT